MAELSGTWFAEPTTNKHVFVATQRLMTTKEEWALPLAGDLSGEVAIHNQRRGSASITAIFQCTKEQLQSEIDDFMTEGSSALNDQTQSALEVVVIAKNKWRIDRQNSGGKVLAVLQSSMTTLSRFLANFSGIVTMAQAADQQYGGLAYGSLSLMLSLFVHKTKREEALDEGFQELSRAFPRLQMLQKLRLQGTTEDHEAFRQLEELIASVFALVIEFAQETARYYSSRVQRIKDAFRDDTAKNKVLEDIRKNMAQIRDACDALVLTKITRMQKKLDDMTLRLEQTHAQVVFTRHQVVRANDASAIGHLAELRQILDVTEGSIHTDLERYRGILDTACFYNERVRSRHTRPRKLSMEILQEETIFSQWWQSSRSSVLLAGGTNFEDHYGSGTLTWLSFAAILAIEELRRQGKHVAVYLAQLGLNVPKRKRVTHQEILANILYQIAEMHDNLLRSKVDKIKRALQSDQWATRDADTFMHEMSILFRDLLSAFPQDAEVYIVIDRLDQCVWEAERDGLSPDSNMRNFIAGLLRIAAEAQCRLRVLLTVDAAASRKVEMKSGYFSNQERRPLLIKAEWVQEIEDGVYGD